MDILVSRCNIVSSETELPQMITGMKPDICGKPMESPILSFAISTVVNADDPCVVDVENSGHQKSGRHGFPIFLPQKARGIDPVTKKPAEQKPSGQDIPVPCSENVQHPVKNEGSAEDKSRDKNSIWWDGSMQNPPKLVPGEAPCGKNIPEALVSCQCDAGNTTSNSSLVVRK